MATVRRRQDSINWAVVIDPTILVSAAVYGLLSLVVSQAGLFGIWLGVLLFFSIWRYCYTLLRVVAQGHKRIPAPDIESFNPVGEWGVFGHMVLYPGLFVASLLYPPTGMIVAVLVAIAFPASAALMGITSNLPHSLSPAAMAEIAKTLGTDYLALVLSYVAVLAGSFIVISLLFSFAGLVALLLSFVVEYWGMFSAFALVGAALRAHRHDFEIPGELVPREEEALMHQHEEWKKSLDIAYASFRSGLNVAGYNTLRKLVDENGDSLEINHWLVENMFEWHDKKYALEVVAKLMPRLLAANDSAAGLELYQRCRRRAPNFRLPEKESRWLAEYARSIGHTGLADELSYT
jgi:hypothetical protein